ncbi:MAG: DUF1573 domain-containing protein [Anaerolineae bacterium]|nr:DUF1573 domain-containing protein [Anaerolineae bacterium]
MKEYTPALSKQPNRFLSFLGQFFKPGWKRVLLGVTGVLIIGFMLCMFSTIGTSNSKINYSPSDVVYGEKIVAVHLLGNISLEKPTAQAFSDPVEEPKIQLSENFYDFGSVSSTQVLTRTFIISNTGKSPLIIQESYTTCGCTTAEFTAKEIPPGKVALMILRFDPAFHKMSGSTVRRGVIIYTNDPEHRTQEIWIQATVK